MIPNSNHRAAVLCMEEHRLGSYPDSEERCCPVCGGNTFEYLYFSEDNNDIIGCSDCVRRERWNEM